MIQNLANHHLCTNHNPLINLFFFKKSLSQTSIHLFFSDLWSPSKDSGHFEAAQEEAAQPDDPGAKDRRGGGVRQHPGHRCRGADCR